MAVINEYSFTHEKTAESKTIARISYGTKLLDNKLYLKPTPTISKTLFNTMDQHTRQQAYINITCTITNI